MVRFLSREWLAALDEAAAASGAGLGMEAGDELVVEQVVETTIYHVVVSAGGAAVRPGPHAMPTVRFTTDSATAAAMHTGAQSALGAFRAGRLEVRGDLATLERHRAHLDQLDEAFQAVQAATEV